MSRGLSIRAVATRVHYSKSYIAAVETGDRIPSLDLARRLDFEFDTGRKLQSLVDPKPVWGVDVDKHDGFRSGTDGGDPVNRQAFLRSLAAAVAGMAVGDPLGDAIGRSMTGTAPDRVGGAEIEQVRHAISMFDAWQDLYGGGVCRDAIAMQVQWGVKLLGADSSDVVKVELHSLVGFLVNIAGWGAFDAGYHESARKYFATALQCAEEAGDWGLRANILSDMARQAVYIGQSDDGLSFIELAQVRQDRQVPEARAMLSTVRARALARVGRFNDAYGAVLQAEDYFSDQNPHEAIPAWIAYFGSAELAGDAGHALTDIALSGQHVDAARTRLRTSLNSYAPAQARARAFSLGKLALLELHVGDPYAGLDYATKSLDAEGPLTSRRAQDDLVGVHNVLDKHSALPGAIDLRDRIGLALGSGSAV